MSFRLTGELICVSIRRAFANILKVVVTGGVKQSCRESEVVISGVRRRRNQIYI